MSSLGTISAKPVSIFRSDIYSTIECIDSISETLVRRIIVLANIIALMT